MKKKEIEEYLKSFGDDVEFLIFDINVDDVAGLDLPDGMFDSEKQMVIERAVRSIQNELDELDGIGNPLWFYIAKRIKMLAESYKKELELIEQQKGTALAMTDKVDKQKEDTGK